MEHESAIDPVRYVALAIPRRDEWSLNEHSDAIWAWNKDNVGLFKPKVPEGLPYDLERNFLADACFKMRNDMRLAVPPVEIEGIVWVDADVAPPPDALKKLLAHRKPLVSALYFARRAPFTPQMYEIAPGETERYWPIMDWEDGKTIEVDACGMGLMWTAFEVLDAIKRLDGYKNLFDFDWPKGEDFYFCRLARQAGYRILVDTSLKTDHWTFGPINESVFKMVRPRLVRKYPDGSTYEKDLERERANQEEALMVEAR